MRVIHLGACLALFAASAFAQGPERTADHDAAQAKPSDEPVTTLALPARVRLSLSNGDRLTGEAIRSEDGQVVVRMGGSPERRKVVSLADVKGVEVSRGKRTHARRAALIGMGAVAAMAVDSCEGCEAKCEYCGWAVAVGGVLGALIGALHKTDRWEEVAVESLSAASGPGGGDASVAGTTASRGVGFSIAPTRDGGIRGRFSIHWK